MTAPADGRTWYQVMGLAPTATAAEIRAAYLSLARNLHPDRHVGGSVSEQQLVERRMREVNAAWAVLGDEAARAGYDVQLRLAEARAAAPPPRPTSRPRAPRPTGTRPVDGDPMVVRPRHHRFDGQVIDDDPGDDDVELTRSQAFLLRRVPIIVAVAVAVAIFVGSALAPRDGARSPADPPTTVSVATTSVP